MEPRGAGLDVNRRVPGSAGRGRTKKNDPGAGRLRTGVGEDGGVRWMEAADGRNRRQFPLSPAAMFWLMLMMMVSFSGLG